MQYSSLLFGFALLAAFVAMGMSFLSFIRRFFQEMSSTIIEVEIKKNGTAAISKAVKVSPDEADGVIDAINSVLEELSPRPSPVTAA